MDLTKLAKEAEKVRETSKKEDKPLTPRELQFSLVYEAGGKEREAVLTSRIMTGDERFQASRVASDIAGRPWNLLPANIQIHAVALGTLAVQLRNPPEWVLSAAQEDEELAIQLFASCRGHDTRWFQRGGSESAEGETRPRIRVTEVGSPTFGDE